MQDFLHLQHFKQNMQQLYTAWIWVMAVVLINKFILSQRILLNVLSNLSTQKEATLVIRDFFSVLQY